MRCKIKKERIEYRKEEISRQGDRKRRRKEEGEERRTEEEGKKEGRSRKRKEDVERGKNLEKVEGRWERGRKTAKG